MGGAAPEPARHAGGPGAALFAPPWWSILRNPAFITRRALHRAVSRLAESVSDVRGEWLDVGCGSRPYEHLFAFERFVGMDVEVSGHDDSDIRCDVYYDGVSFPFADATYDGVLCTQVLEHAVDAEAVVAEIARVLKPGGAAVITAPFVWPEHEVPYDFRRFTSAGLRALLERHGLSVEDSRPTSGSAETVAQLRSLWLHSRVGRGVPGWSSVVTLLLCAPVQASGLLRQAVWPDDGSLYLDTAVLARRKGGPA